MFKLFRGLDILRRWDGFDFNVRDKVISEFGIRNSEIGKDWKNFGTMKDEGRTMNLGTMIDDCLSCKELATVQDRLTNKKNKEENNTSNFQNRYRFKSTQDIIDAAYDGLLPNQIMMTFHPQRWTDKPVLWVKELVWQNMKNGVKWGLVNYSRLKMEDDGET